MERMEWNTRWELGDTKLDEQHHVMVETLNRLGDAIDRGEAREGSWKTISFLLLYAHSHFREEESLMERTGFPNLAEHRAKHDNCARHIEDLLTSYRNGEGDTVPRLVAFFQFWLTDHFQGADRVFGDFLKTRQGEAPALRALIVEDDPLTRKFLHAVLAPYGPCDVAAAGEQALEAYQAAARKGLPYTVVCLDINMPGMDGHRALAAIRSVEEIHGLPRARVLMTTGSKDPRDVNAAFQSACDQYLVKPIKSDRLLASLKELGCLV